MVRAPVCCDVVPSPPCTGRRSHYRRLTHRYLREPGLTEQCRPEECGLTDSLLQGHGREQRHGGRVPLQIVRQVLHHPQDGQAGQWHRRGQVRPPAHACHSQSMTGGQST